MNNAKFAHRHYAAIADVLANAREEEGALTGSAVIRAGVLDRLEDRLVRMFRADNYGFKPDRFRKAARRAPDMHGKDKVR